MINPKLIARINELAKIAKERELTSEEIIERDKLRQEYIKEFKKGFRQQLESIKIVDENGNEINNKEGDA